MPTRFERWIRSKLSAMHEPDAEQRRTLGRPVARRARAVFAAGDDRQRHAFGGVAHRDVVDEALLAVGQVDRVRALPCPPTSRLRSRMLANVPRIITSWWPRRAPYELNSSGPTPCAWSHWPAGDARRDRAGRRDVVGRDRIAEDGQDARARRCRATGRGSSVEALEERRLGDVGRAVRPRRSGRPTGSAARASGRRRRRPSRRSAGRAPGRWRRR